MTDCTSRHPIVGRCQRDAAHDGMHANMYTAVESDETRFPTYTQWADPSEVS